MAYELLIRDWSSDVCSSVLEADLLLGHGAVVELVDAVGQLGGDGGLGLGAAEHEDAVERLERRLGAVLAGAARGELGDELGPAADEARVAVCDDRPQVAEPALGARAGEGATAAGPPAAPLPGGVSGGLLAVVGLRDDALAPPEPP